MTILPRKGILVSETDPRKQLLVLEVRRELERLLARLGAQRASEEQRTRFRQIADGMDRAARSNDDIAFMRLDRELNLLISDAAHNDYAARAMRFLHGHSRRFWYMHYKAAADLPLCARLHAAQARAIAAGEQAGRRGHGSTHRLHGNLHPSDGCAMKTYAGTRSIDGLVVTVDGRRCEHYEVKRFTKWGFEWTYEGASPQQLALAILYDHLGDKERAIRLSEPFMKKVVADLDNDWTLSPGISTSHRGDRGPLEQFPH